MKNKKKFIYIMFILVLIVFVCCMFYINRQKSRDKVVEPVYTQDCFPKTLQQSGVTKECFENANFGNNSFCSQEEISKIEEYYKKGQDKDPLNDGSGHFCAD